MGQRLLPLPYQDRLAHKAQPICVHVAPRNCRRSTSSMPGRSGLAAGQLEGAPIRFATEIARVADDGDNMNVLPIVTRGPSDNVEALLYLKGVDVAIINSGRLQQFKTLVPNIQQRITYILSLFPVRTAHLRPAGDQVARRPQGQEGQLQHAGHRGRLFGAADLRPAEAQRRKDLHSAPGRHGADEGGRGRHGGRRVHHLEADRRLRARQVAAWLQVPAGAVRGLRVLSAIHPDLQRLPRPHPAGQEIQTIAVPTILAAFNWPKNSDRYRRVARLTDNLFSRLDQLQGEGFHPKWKDVNLAAKVPGLKRFPAAQEWLDSLHAAAAPAPVAVSAASSSGYSGVAAMASAASPTISA